MSVLIGYLHPGTVRGEFMRSVLLVVRNGRASIEDIVDMRSGANISRARNHLAQAFLESCASDWLWMIDSDMVFAEDTLDRLLAVADPIERPIVGALCYKVNDDPSGPPLPVVYGPTEWPESECIRVDATGAACLLVHRTALQRIWGKYDPPAPWFFETIEDGQYYGEDVTFCRRAASVGLSVHVHTGIRVGHMKSAMLGTIK